MGTTGIIVLAGADILTRPAISAAAGFVKGTCSG